MGFFGNLVKLGKAVNGVLKPKTILDHVQERIKALDEEMQSGRRFVSIRRIWNWMKENERMRLCGCDSLNERLQEELEKTDKEKTAKDSYDVLGREFPLDPLEDERKEADNSSKEVYESIKKVRESARKVEDVLAASRMPTEKDVHYYGEAYLLNHYAKAPEVNDVVIVRNEDGIWTASTVQGVEGSAVWCEGDWNEEHLPYRFNEELVGTARNPKDPASLRWGDKVWVADDLKDDPEIAIFIGFNPNGESELRWLTLSSAEHCLESFSDQKKWPPFGHWKYMWRADGDELKSQKN